MSASTLTLPKPSSPAAQRPAWLPNYLPELQGLRGLAVLFVVIYHCHPRLTGTWIYKASLWGWAGVNLFFVLSGFLITSILLGSADKPHYYRNFYGHRALRIWPVYLLTLAWVYLNSEWFIGPPVWTAVRTAPWWAYLLFLQNLVKITLPPALVPTWTLAIEQQYYLCWAPLVRWLRKPWLMALAPAAILVGGPVLHRLHPAWLTSLNTLINLDGIAMGSLIAIGLYSLRLPRRVWIGLGMTAFCCGFGAAATVAGGTVYLNTALATGFSGAVLAAIAANGSRNPISVALRRGPLPFYGKISYGMYMIHIGVFIYFGAFDKHMDAYGIWGNWAVVAVRLLASTLAAAALWYGFESRVLKLKKYF